MPDLAGKTLGDFQVEALIGKGSMARVYRASQISLRRPVALKVLKEELFTPGLKIKRFLREAEALARLEHPHIVPIYAAGEAAPYYYFAMRLVPGGTLADAMARGIERKQAFDWLLSVCRGLAQAHGAGVIHRDMKPTNILLSGDSVLLADFGLAHLRDLSTLTQSGQILGTPLYMSPEQTLGEPPGPATDCFALGVLLYQLMTGEHPFVDLRQPLTRPSDQAELFHRIQNAAAIPPRQLAGDIPAALEAVILRAIARDPGSRYADAGAMLQAMEALEESLPHSGEPVRQAAPVAPPVEPPPEPPRTRATPGETAVDHPQAKLGNHESTAASSQFRFGRYEVLGELGHGGQGSVYRARDTLLGREVALKVLQGGWHAGSGLLEIFRKEAQIAASLNHPHIIPILDYGFTDQSPYLTMPIIEGPSLEKLIGAAKPLGLDFALQILLQTADALDCAHTSGILHLDVKPGNILLQKLRGRRNRVNVVLSDFTMAKLLSARRNAHDSKITSGTIPYASPEQLTNDNQALCPASDLFALGVIFHEMLTGRRLFSSAEPSIDRMLVLHSQILPPSSRTPGIPPGVDAMCLRLLERSPQARFQSAQELIAAVEALSAGFHK